MNTTSLIEQRAEELEVKWSPNPKQYKFAQLPFEVHEALYGGSLGAGKTEILLLLCIIYRLYENPKFRGLFLRRTFPELEAEVIPRSQEIFPSLGAVYNISKHRWQWQNGAYFGFGHMKDEKDVKNYDSGQYSLICWDEATHFTGYQYEYLTLRRNRAPAGSGLPSITRAGSNPGKVGHVYFRKRFIDPYKLGGKLIRDPKTGSLRTFVPATANDNPHLLESNPNYYENLKGLSEAEYRAMVLGDWYTFEGQVFDEWRLEPMNGEPNVARHVIEPFNIPDWWPKVMGIDWGFAAFCFVIWAAISPEGRVFIYRTYAVKKAKIRTWTRDIAMLSAGEIDSIRDVRLCHSAVQDRGQDQTIYEQVSEALSEAGFTCSLTLGDRGRVAGKQLVHEYLRWKPLPNVKNIIGDFDIELANKIERIHGRKKMEEYWSYFQPEKAENNIPRLQIFSKSPEGKSTSDLTECIASCVYDETKKEDVKEFDGDDAYDCLRITLNAVRDYFDESKNEFEKREKYGLAGKKLAETGDQTAYYRMCEKLEASESESFSVRRMSSMRGARRNNRIFTRGFGH